MVKRWFHRTIGVIGLAARRVAGRVQTSPQRLLLSVLGVAVAVGLMIAVTGVSLGLASESVIQSEGVDYWIVPEKSTVSTVAVSSGSVQLGAAHSISDRLERDERVDHVTPVSLELVPVTDRVTGDREYILAAGIIPAADAPVFSGMSTRGLAPGDPYYANGSYNGSWTGGVVLNEAAATLLNASTGDTLRSSRATQNQSLRVRNVTVSGLGVAGGSAPVMIMHLSELQALSGATSGDQADQILVSTNDPSVRSELETVYPQTTVVTKSGLSAQETSLSNLPLAVAVAALAVGIVVGVLFVATLMGLEVSASEQELAVLGAVGYSTRHRMLLIATESVLVSIAGGIVGSGFGVAGLYAINNVIAPRVGLETVARFDLLLLGYALVVALVIGILGMIYPALLSRRTDILEGLTR
ncbi:ABC transporter permease [Halorientalis marina]|uniref:ABC transporter permease n=1 Tax=Halorientalis marina TaxID=2931976 RepID=UPI001FF2C161|nr:ABC transporter permease [Halorientalis marina]